MERFTVKQAADYLGVCDDTIYTMVREKEIPHFKLRRRIMFSKEAIDTWIFEQENNSTKQAMYL